MFLGPEGRGIKGELIKRRRGRREKESTCERKRWRPIVIFVQSRA